MSIQVITYTENDVRQLQDKLIDLANNSFKMPTSGACETKHGEMLRAVTRIIYRYFNDGDSMFVGYGCETCGHHAAYLKHEFSEFADPIQKGLNDLLLSDDQMYVQILGEIASKAVIIIETQDDEPRGKEVFDYEQEWENNMCDGCDTYYPADQLASDGMGSQYCSCCGDYDEDE